MVNCKVIKNFNYPACKNCIHYRPPTYTNDFTNALGQCGCFGEKDIVTNEIKYEYADLCRYDEAKCGIEGKYFEEEGNIDMKIWKHWLFVNTPFLSFLFITMMPLVFKLCNFFILKR